MSQSQEPARAQMFFILASFQHQEDRNNFCLRVYLDGLLARTDSMSALKAAETVQVQMLGCFWEKLLRCKDESKMRSVVQSLLAHVFGMSQSHSRVMGHSHSLAIAIDHRS